MARPLCISYPFGTLVRLVGEFTRPPTQAEIDDGTACDSDDWQAVDPDTVTVKVMDPAGDYTTHDFNGSPGDVVNDAVGHYYLDITPTIAGQWFFRYDATGNGASADEGNFIVESSVFP